MKAKVAAFLDEHPFVTIFLWIFVVFPILSKLALWFFDVKSCRSYLYGRRQNIAYECEWSGNPVVDFILDMTIGPGPIIGPVMVILFAIFPMYVVVDKVRSHLRGGDKIRQSPAKEVTPLEA